MSIRIIVHSSVYYSMILLFQNAISFILPMTLLKGFIYLVAYLSSYHEKAINALYELA